MEDYNIQYDGYVGIDEVARGNLFGPSVFVAVKLKVPFQELSFAVDSKTTNKKQRKDMIEKIKNSVDYFIVEIPPSKIDEEGLSKGIHDALEEIKNHFDGDNFLYDGDKTFGVDGIETLVKADGKVVSVSCASIIAKEYLDNLMVEYHNKYPEYGLDTNSGYATQKHIEAIIKFGYTPMHRKSYNVKAIETHKNTQIMDSLF
jgi:ribonuclease HII